VLYDELKLEHAKALKKIQDTTNTSSPNTVSVPPLPLPQPINIQGMDLDRQVEYLKGEVDKERLRSRHLD
jgi:hypothetical protein